VGLRQQAGLRQQPERWVGNKSDLGDTLDCIAVGVTNRFNDRVINFCDKNDENYKLDDGSNVHYN
jgi:hypothetical protein